LFGFLPEIWVIRSLDEFFETRPGYDREQIISFIRHTRPKFERPSDKETAEVLEMIHSLPKQAWELLTAAIAIIQSLEIPTNRVSPVLDLILKSADWGHMK
jgi:hypothetical protein